VSPRRLRVLFLIGYLSDQGGAERLTLGLATQLPRDRFEPTVCFARGAGPAAVAALQEANIPFVDLGRRAKWDVHRMGGLVRLLRSERIDVLHAHMFGSNLWGTMVGRVCKVPVVIAHEHTWSYRGNPLRAWLDGHVIGRLATRFVAVSNQDARRMVEYEGVPVEKVIVMPTAYIPRPAGEEQGDIRNELGLGAQTLLIATATVLRPQKALEVLLEAHAAVLRAVPDAHLLIAGAGPCLDSLRARADALSLDGHVHFLGHRRDVDAILTAADVGALSSDFEGMPLFAFECMAARTPLVTTAVGALPDLIENQRSGLLIPPRDPDALAQALISLLEDPARRAALAAAAFERLAPFTLEAMTDRFAALYVRLFAEAAQ
jgi:glycosyltransferase involved in cell wall biosynthesis